MLHASECWAPRVADLQRLLPNERLMLRWMFGVRADEHRSHKDLLDTFMLSPLDMLLRSNRLRWFGHVKHSQGWINKVMSHNVPGKKPRGRPTLTWKELVMKDLTAWRMPKSADNRQEWRQRIRLCLKSNPI